MFEKFSDRSIRSIQRAQDEARRLGHNYVGTEHILLALLADGAIAETLIAMGLNKNDARQKLLELIGRGSGFVSVEIPFTWGAQRILRLAVLSMQELNHEGVTPEHLLIALVDAGSAAIEVLTHFQIDLTELRQKAISEINRSIQARSLAPEQGDSTSQRKELLEKALIEFGNVMLYSLNIADALYMIANITGKIMQSSRCIVICSDNTQPDLKCYEYWQKDSVQSCREIHWPKTNSPLVAQILLTDAPISVSDEGCGSDLSSVQTELRSIGAKSILAVALRSHHTVHGCLILHQCDEWRNWTKDEIEYLERVAGIIAEGLVRVR